MKESNSKTENTIFAIFVSVFSMCIGFLLGVFAKLGTTDYPKSSLENQNKATDDPVLIDWKTSNPVRVVLVDENQLTSTGVKSKRQIRIGILLFGFLAFLIGITLSIKYTARKIQILSPDPSTRVQFSINYPAYYSLGDQTKIQVSARNISDTEVSNIILVVEPSLENLFNAGIENSNKIDFGTLLPSEIKTREVTFIIQDSSTKKLGTSGEIIVVTTKVDIKNQLIPLMELRLRHVPIPYLSSFLTVLYVSSLVWGTLGLFYRDTISFQKLIGAPLVGILFNLLLSIVANLLTDVIKNAATGILGR